MAYRRRAQPGDAAPLDALADILTQDRVSRLTKLLVYDRQMATSVAAGNTEHENEGVFSINLNPRPGVSLTRLEQLTDSVLMALRATAPSQAEVDRTKRYAVVGTVTGLESTESRADQLAEGQTFFNDPLHFQVELKEAQAVTPADVERVARRYLTPGRVVFSMVPAGHLDLVSKTSRPYVNVTKAPERPAKGQPDVESNCPSNRHRCALYDNGAGRRRRLHRVRGQESASPPRPVPGPAPAVRVPRIENAHSGETGFALPCWRITTSPWSMYRPWSSRLRCSTLPARKG